jgi:hypothetical protein
MCHRRHKKTGEETKRHQQQLCTFQWAEDVEDDLKQHTALMEHWLFGLTATQLCENAFQIAERNGISHSFNKYNKRGK